MTRNPIRWRVECSMNGVMKESFRSLPAPAAIVQVSSDILISSTSSISATGLSVVRISRRAIFYPFAKTLAELELEKSKQADWRVVQGGVQTLISVSLRTYKGCKRTFKQIYPSIRSSQLCHHTLQCLEHGSAYVDSFQYLQEQEL